MDVIGKWKISEVLSVGEDSKLVWKTVEEELKNEDADPKMLSVIMNFCEDGVLKTLMPLPAGVSQEEIDAAVAAGEVELEDGMMLVETQQWKTEDGKLYFDTGIQGEVFGEAVSPWEEIKVDGDALEMSTYKIVRL